MISIQSSVAIAFCLVAALATPAIAQSSISDTLPFRKGQWGVEFPIQSSYSITLLRFSSNRTAWLVDGVISIISDERDGAVSPAESQQLFQDYTLRLGKRAYRRLAFNTAGFVDLGLAPRWNAFRSFQDDNTGSEYETRRHTASLGVFATIGANYFLTSRLALGMSSTTELSYRMGKERSVIRSPGMVAISEFKTRGYGFSAHTAVITASIYF